MRILSAGFTLVILLLLVAAFASVRNVRAIQENAATLVEEQRQSIQLVDEVQRQQEALTAIFYRLAGASDALDRQKALAELDQADENITRILAETEGSLEEELGRELEKTSAEFTAEARRLLGDDKAPSRISRHLLEQHQHVVSIVASLIATSHRKAQAAQQMIDSRSRELGTQSLFLLGACLMLALLFALLTVRMTAGLFHKMESQAGELSRVSWHLLENQETTARRFSHELHDELGQALTALKANLVSLGTSQAPDKRLEDSLQLVNEAIQNVRELSQLLRPTILDDFGLDAGLRWLAERFTQRTGIETEYVSNFSGRLSDETETHLFRIAQEAMTNVARHSGASKVRVELRTASPQVCLSIRDNGGGLRAGGPECGMGMVGMRARARSMGGELAIRSLPGEGLAVEASVPHRSTVHEQEDPHPAGR